MKATRDDFEVWLIEMDRRLGRLEKLLPRSVQKHLNFSQTSLDAVEAWLLSRYNTPKEILTRQSRELFDCLSTYVGETMRKVVGGKWNINLTDPSDVFFQVPVLQREDEWTESPGSLITAAIDRRTGKYMSEVVSAYQ